MTNPKASLVELKELLGKITPVSGMKFREKNGEDRYELIGKPCGFPVAIFGHGTDAEFDLACREAFPSLLARIEEMELALTELNAHFKRMQRTATEYLCGPPRGISEDGFISTILYQLDGPEQRKVQALSTSVLEGS